ncbi:transient receptor potential cation channel subfamily M member 8-like isoform X2 [Biomphalaria glabrata]|uniref:Transient receptor potential cation channel subfamily M member 8-like isoform X2 n=1 Tax=Biomphalaria glabrata TaxID=6526 RepID=A0A9W2YDM4_BIOGL|nr:transient receptor potential cation channel subfamily M member 8-like isoform X2 [Biomphalaria glabrata]
MAFSCFKTRSKSPSKNQVSPEPIGKNRPIINTGDGKKLDTFCLNYPGFGYKITTHKGYFLERDGSEQVIDTEKLASLWNLPSNSKLMAYLIGSIEKDVHHKTSYDIREFIAHLAKFLVRNNSWLLAVGENASFFKCLGHILKNTMFETSDTKPAIVGVSQKPDLSRSLRTKNSLRWYNVSKEEMEDLDQNINHYIFTSDMNVSVQQSETNTTTDNQNQKNNEKEKKNEKAKNTFECIFLCNGTSDSMLDIEFSLKKQRAIIILKRSGGVADILSDIIEIQQREGESNMEHTKNVAANKILELKRLSSSSDLDQGKIVEIITIILKQIGKQVQILDISKKLEEKNITEVIFKAVDGAEREAKRLNTDSYIMLCLHLDQLEIAAEIGGLWQVVENNNKALCKEILQTALSLRRYSFVRYLLEQGLNPNDYIDATDVSPTLQLMINQEMSRNDNEIRDVKMTPKQKRTALLIKEFCAEATDRKKIVADDVMGETEAAKTATLFKLSIVEERMELANIIWQKLDSPTGAALYGYKILKELHDLEPHIEQQLQIKEWMKHFQNYAIETINRTYNKQPGEAIKLLGQKMENWGNTTCLMLALTGGNKTFLSQLACREFNSRIWYFGSLVGTKEVSLNHESETDNISEGFSESKCCTLREDIKDSMRYFFAPSVLCYFRFLSHVAFLILFAIILISILRVESFHWLEWLLWAWVGTYLFEQINQIARNPIKLFPLYPLSQFFLLEFGSILLFAVAWGLRLVAYFFPENPDYMTWARVLLSIDFITFSVSTLEVCCIHSFFGPILLMIMKMFKTLAAFLLIVAIFFIAYAIASESVLYPESRISPLLVFHLLKKAFWVLFGEFFLSELENGQSCTRDPALYNTYSELRCPTTAGSYYVPPLMGAYYVIVNIMLFNLLIALFSSTIEKVSQQALEVWHHQSLQMTLKYAKVIVLPPPFTIFTPFLWICRSSDVDQPFSKEITKQNLVNLKKIEVDEQRNFIQYMDVKGSLPVCKCNFICQHKDSDKKDQTKIYIKDMASQTESILRAKEKSKEDKKYFAMRSRNRSGIQWKLVGIKKVKKTRKGGNTVPSAVLPEIEYLD